MWPNSVQNDLTPATKNSNSGRKILTLISVINTIRKAGINVKTTKNSKIFFQLKNYTIFQYIFSCITYKLSLEIIVEIQFWLYSPAFKFSVEDQLIGANYTNSRCNCRKQSWEINRVALLLAYNLVNYKMLGWKKCVI